jgi:hypothetical protein
MVEIQTDLTREFNEYITNVLDDMINNNFNTNGLVSFSIESTLLDMIDNDSINNILNNSFEDDEKGLVRDDKIKLYRFDIYNEDDEVECCICQDDDLKIKKGCEVYKCIECKNTFHKNCMDNWVKMKVECPMCRCDITDDVIQVDAFEEWLNENIDI